MKYVRPYWKYFVLGPLCMIVEILGEVFLPRIYSLIINNGIANRDPAYVAWACAFMVLTAVLMMLGGVGGGLAAGLGNFLYDLTDPRFIASAPFTFIFKFAMAYVCAVLAYGFHGQAKRVGQNIVAGAAGALTYVVLYLGKNFIEYRFLQGMELQAVLVDVMAKAPVSLFNALVAVAVAVPLTYALQKALKAAGFAGGRQDVKSDR
jgi:ABC-type multidrug transport system fused ATPase/permease subunit